MTTSRQRKKSWLLATASSLILAAGGALVAPTLANADDATVEDGTLSWGIRESWRAYVGVDSGQPGPGAPGMVLGEDGATASASGVGSWQASGGAVNVDAGTGVIDFQGTLLILGHPGSFYPYEYPESSGQKWGLWQRWAEPKLTFTSATTAKVSFAVSSFSAAPSFPNVNPAARVDVVDLTFSEGDIADGKATSISAVLTPAGALTVWDSYGTYQPGVEMDPVTVSFAVEQESEPEATPTTTVISASPSNVIVGGGVTLTATVTPAAAGAVQFVSNGGNLGVPVPVQAGIGIASLTSTAFPVGTHSITAVFTPADPHAFGSSTSQTAASVTVNSGVTTTATQLTVSPDQPVALGAPVTLTATVTDEDPAKTPQGSVQFFETPNGGAERTVGPPVAIDAGGVAKLTTSALGAGGHSLRAVFTSTNGFDSSVGSVTANYGVVDTKQPLLCVATGGEVLTGVEASWDWSAYSNSANHVPGGSSFAWQKHAEGDIEVVTSADAETFVLSGGVATVSDECTHIAFTGTMRVEAYHSFFPTHGQWVELVDPELFINADGTGAWVAGVRSGEKELNNNVLRRLTILTVRDAPAVDFDNDEFEDAAVNFAYANTTAAGTWSPNRTGAWSNGFVIQVPSAIRSFYYESGAGADANKPASPLLLNWKFESTVAGTVNGEVEGTSVERGKQAVFAASGFRAGELVNIVVGDQTDLGEYPADESGAVSFTWAVPTNFELGVYPVAFSGVASDRSAQASFEVIPALIPVSNNNPDDGQKSDPKQANDDGGQQLSKTGAEGIAAGLFASIIALLGGAGLIAASRRKVTRI